MMMVPAPDDPTKRLLRLMALKRFETPPPGFFDRFPNRVLVNIRAGAEPDIRPFWQRVFRGIIAEPMVVGSYAALGVGALLFGVSVFQMAVDREAPTLAGLDGIAAATPGIPLPVAGSLAPGLIYHVTPAHLPINSDADLVSVHLNGAPHPTLETIGFREPTAAAH